MEGHPEEEAVGLILLDIIIISLLWKYCKVFSKRKLNKFFRKEIE